MECNTVKCIASLWNVVSRPRTSKIFLLTELQYAVLCPSYFDQTVSTTKYFARVKSITLCSVLCASCSVQFFSLSLYCHSLQFRLSSMRIRAEYLRWSWYLFQDDKENYYFWNTMCVKVNIQSIEYKCANICPFCGLLALDGLHWTMYFLQNIVLHYIALYILHCGVMHCILL